MSQAKSTITDMLHSNGPLPSSTVISRLFETGMEPEKAAEAVNTVCEIQERNGEEYVVGVKDVKDNGTLDISSLEQTPGEPTGEVFTGKIIKGEPQIVEEGVGLPVLEDVGHPGVPDMDHDYLQREMPYGDRTDLEVVVRTIADPDYATLLIGETGVGKNVLLKKIFSVCNWPCQRVNFGLGVDYESLVGRFAPSEGGNDFDSMLDTSTSIASQHENVSTGDVMQSISAQKSYFEFVSGILRQCTHNGYAFIGDEINTVTGEVTSSLHGVTEERSSRELVVQDTSEVVNPDDRFRFIGTMNPEDYAGTNPLNRAFKTRFYPIKIPYLEETAEVNVFLEKSNLSEHDNGEAIANGLVSLATKIRNQKSGGTEAGAIRTTVSTRDLIKIGNIIADPNGEEFMRPKAATKTILEGVAEPGDWTAIQTVIGNTSIQ